MAEVVQLPTVEERLFQYWKDLMGYKRARFDDKRRRVLTGRRREGYSEEDLRLAIEGCFLSPFHQGENERNTRYDDIVLIFRDASHVDKFVQLAEDCFDRHSRLTRKKEEAKEEPKVDYLPPEKARARLYEIRKALAKR